MFTLLVLNRTLRAYWFGFGLRNSVSMFGVASLSKHIFPQTVLGLQPEQYARRALHNKENFLVIFLKSLSTAGLWRTWKLFFY